jgi:hypothetical protein
VSRHQSIERRTVSAVGALEQADRRFAAGPCLISHGAG